MDQSIARIRQATRPLHERLDVLPYARRALAGDLPMRSYVGFLRAVYEVVRALEETLERAGDPALRALCTDAPLRREALERDLTALAVDRHAVDAAVLSGLVLAQRLRLAGARDRNQLLGFAYVLEGSQLGGLVQHAALSARPELAAGGLSYLAGRGRDTGAAFSAFLERLGHELTSEAAIDAAIAGATAAFEGFQAILEALDPDRPETRWLTPALNADAGTHAVPTDLREVAAALDAGQRTFQRYAYYEARYGERGRRFTRSDSAWLTTLAREEGAMLSRQLHWLGRVLASRGMPQRLLEEHLDELHDALVAAVPERAASYAPLREGARQLRDERVAVLPEEQAQLFVTSFAAGLTPEAGISPEEAGTLLLAAVADERNGLLDAVGALTSWLANPERFSRTWLSHVQRTLTKVRSGVAPKSRRTGS